MHSRTIRVIAALGVFGGLAAGCVANRPKVLVSNRYLSEKVAMTVLQKTGEKADDVELYNYILRLCDVDDSGGETGCQESIVLENVVP